MTMKRRQAIGWGRMCALVLLALGCDWAWSAESALALEDKVRAAYIVKFFEYVDWPASAFADAAAPYVLGVAASPAFFEEVARSARGRIVAGRPLSVRRVADGTLPAPLHAVYIPAWDRVIARFPELRGAHRPILVITDQPAEPPEGSMINLLEVDGRVRFQVNLLAAEKAGLRFSSRLLAVALRVYKGEAPAMTLIAGGPAPARGGCCAAISGPGTPFALLQSRPVPGRSG